MPVTLEFFVVILACTFLVLFSTLMTNEFFAPVLVRQFDRSGRGSVVVTVLASLAWLLLTLFFCGLLYIRRAWLAEAALLVTTAHLFTVLVVVRSGTRGNNANALDWLATHGATQQAIRDSMQIRIVADLTIWACVITMLTPVVTMATAGLHQLDPRVYSAAVIATLLCCLPLSGLVAVTTYTRATDRLLRILGHICATTVSATPRRTLLDSWLLMYSRSAEIWTSGRNANRRSLEEAQRVLRRLLKDRARRIVNVNPSTFLSDAQFLVDGLAQLSDDRDDIRNSSALTRVVRFAILGHDKVLPRSAFAPPALSNDKAWSRLPIRKVIGIITVAIGLVSSSLALSDRLWHR